ncbi:MAG: hypothetical protein CME84_16130 [Henriciella sp.]|nr:hypothetical protein [Henriciella sp.]|tara:strand:+ start:231 stop:425 length:195 start_codon:yes stop_codon:yes gene_type:complete
MKVQDLLDIQEVIYQRASPVDLRDDRLVEHYSESKDEYMSILDMDLVHLIRAYNKTLYTKRHEL